MSDVLNEEINKDREEHDKKPLKEKENDKDDNNSHEIKRSTTDPSSILSEFVFVIIFWFLSLDFISSLPVVFPSE